MAAGWRDTVTVKSASWVCGFCNNRVASSDGYNSSREGLLIRICPQCRHPTYFTNSNVFPMSAPGNRVENVPFSLDSLYNEARNSFTVRAYTGTVLICRKILMHIAVDKGSEPGLGFLEYVEFLASEGFLPPDGRTWVDYIRKRGNEANHKIMLMSEEDAKALITFVEMLLRFIYHFPTMVPQEIAQSTNHQN